MHTAAKCSPKAPSGPPASPQNALLFFAFICLRIPTTRCDLGVARDVTGKRQNAAHRGEVVSFTENREHYKQ